MAGNVDVFCTDQLEQALHRIGIATPGGTVVVVAGLLEPRAKVEIEATAVIP